MGSEVEEKAPWLSGGAKDGRDGIEDILNFLIDEENLIFFFYPWSEISSSIFGPSTLLQNFSACESLRGKKRACLKNIYFSKKVLTFYTQILKKLSVSWNFLHAGRRFNAKSIYKEIILRYLKQLMKTFKSKYFNQSFLLYFQSVLAYVTHFVFERCLDSNTQSCRSKQVRYQLSHPSPPKL